MGRSLDQSLFDEAYYRQQLAAKVAEPPLAGPGRIAALEHYLAHGFRVGLNPTRFFDQAWYTWQNPDYHTVDDNAYFHYLEAGRFHGRDPSPLVDITRFDAVLGRAVPPAAQYQAILNGLRAPTLGVYEDWDDLLRAEEAFRQSVRVFGLRAELKASPRRNLIFLQAGRNSLHRSWFRPESPRTWDLLANYYDPVGLDPEFGEYVFCQTGTKFTAMANIWRMAATLLRRYEYILFLDDDIFVDFDDMDRFFDICGAKRLDMAQMALSAESHAVWPIFFQEGRHGVRLVNGVEIMMPAFSRAALERIGDHLGSSISGFGLDFLFGWLLGSGRDANIGIVDDVVAHHTRAIDDRGGAFYSYMRANLINPKAELWHLASTFGFDTSFHEV